YLTFSANIHCSLFNNVEYVTTLSAVQSALSALCYVRVQTRNECSGTIICTLLFYYLTSYSYFAYVMGADMTCRSQFPKK
ncbi:unnamed protein product, partial [Leptidea sinapis]